MLGGGVGSGGELSVFCLLRLSWMLMAEGENRVGGGAAGICSSSNNCCQAQGGRALLVVGRRGMDRDPGWLGTERPSGGYLPVPRVRTVHGGTYPSGGKPASSVLVSESPSRPGFWVRCTCGLYLVPTRRSLSGNLAGATGLATNRMPSPCCAFPAAGAPHRRQALAYFVCVGVHG